MYLIPRACLGYQNMRTPTEPNVILGGTYSYDQHERPGHLLACLQLWPRVSKYHVTLLNVAVACGLDCPNGFRSWRGYKYISICLHEEWSVYYFNRRIQMYYTIFSITDMVLGTTYISDCIRMNTATVPGTSTLYCMKACCFFSLSTTDPLPLPLPSFPATAAIMVHVDTMDDDERPDPPCAEARLCEPELNEVR